MAGISSPAAATSDGDSEVGLHETDEDILPAIEPSSGEDSDDELN